MKKTRKVFTIKTLTILLQVQEPLFLIFFQELRNCFTLFEKRDLEISFMRYILITVNNLLNSKSVCFALNKTCFA